MFDFVRSNTRLLQLLLLLLIVPSFVFFGVQGYSRFTEGGQATVAKVDGRAITQSEWDLAHQRQAERMRRQMPGLDAKFFDQPQMKRETLDALVRERVLFAAVNDRHLAVSDQRIVRELMSMPELASVRRPEGGLDKAAYLAFLQAQGLDVSNFEAGVRQDLALRQVTQPLAESVLAPNAVARQGLEALLQKRDVQVQRFDTKDYVAKVNPSDAEIDAYYKAREVEFRAPEQATIEYVVLDLETLKKGITVSEDDLRKYYDENASRYSTAEERRASHILIKADKDAPAADKQKAKAKAEALLAELRKNKAAFAELAKKNSDDPGSAERGGDLDFFGRGAMVKPFEDTVFAMKPGEISNLVESDFGYHIIRLDAVRGGEKKPFEAVRASIEDEVKKQLAQRRYSEAAEQFTNTVFEQPDSLQPVIDKLKLQKQTATVTRTPAAGASGVLASAKLLEAVFGNDALKNKRNTDAVEIGPSQLASARVVQHMPARTLPLAEVKEAVRQRVVMQQAAALARKEGETKLAQLKQAADAALPAAVSVSRSQPQGLPRMVVDAVLRADASKLPATIGISMGDEGYAVVRIVKVEPPALQGDELKQLQTAYARAWSAAETGAYYEALKRRYKAEVKVAAPVADAASPAQR